MPFPIEPLLTVPELIIRRAESTPDHPAWKIWENGHLKTITWKEYYQTIQCVTHNLSGAGIKTNDHFFICAHNALAWEIIEKAGLFLGAVIVAVDPNAPAETHRHVLRQTHARVLVTDNLQQVKHLTDIHPVDYTCAIVLSSDHSPPLAATFPVLYYETLINPPANGRQILTALPNPEQTATIIYTSGSTGTPKGIPFTQRQYLITAQAMLDSRLPPLHHGIAENQTTICWLPLYNLFQRVINTLFICWGGCSYLLDDPKRILETTRMVNPTLMIGIPRFYEKLQSATEQQISTSSSLLQKWTRRCLSIGLAYGTCHEWSTKPSWWLQIQYRVAEYTTLRHLRHKLLGKHVYTLITGSAPTPKHVLAFFQSIGAPLLEAYGLSENIIPMAMNRPGARRSGSVGKPLLYHQVILADDQELLVKGPGIFHGYLEASEDSKPFTKEGLLRTGDYGQIDNDGFLFLTGRKSDLIKTSTGRRIFPRQIEAGLTRLPLVEHAVVIGNNQKYLTAILALAPGFYTSFEEARVQCQQHIDALNGELSAYEQIQGALLLPSGFSIERGHLTLNMKIRRKAIETMYENEIRELYKAIEKKKEKIVVILLIDSN